MILQGSFGQWGFFKLFIIFGCAGSSLLYMGFSLVVVSRNFSFQCPLLLRSRDSRAHGPQNFGHMGSVVVAHGLLLQVMWDLSSPTRDRPRILCIARWILNCWTLGKS